MMEKVKSARVNSIVNKVSIIKEDERNLIIKKEFQKKAVKTGIDVPILRSEVEYLVNRYLHSKIDNRFINLAVPEIIEYDKVNHILYFEFIKGINLLSCSKKDFPPKYVFEELFKFLSDLGNDKKASRVFNGLESISERCQKIIYDYKFPNYAFKQNNNECLCLGDVNLSNMIWSNNKLYLLDFEFAHWGAGGYDIGQVFAHIDVRHDIDEYEFVNSNDMVIYWRKLFKNYYSNK